MKKLSNSVVFEAKGLLTNYANGLLEVTKIKSNGDDEIDEIDFNDLLLSLKKFCEENIEKDVVVKFSAVATDSE